jgi:hypothetical protein
VKQSRCSRYPLLSFNRATGAAGSARALRALLRVFRDSLTFGDSSDLLVSRGFPAYRPPGNPESEKSRDYTTMLQTSARHTGHFTCILAFAMLARVCAVALRHGITYRAERARPASGASGSKILLKPFVRRTLQIRSS